MSEVITKSKPILKFLHRKNKCLTPNLLRALVFAGSVWYASLFKKLKNEIQTSAFVTMDCWIKEHIHRRNKLNR